MEEEKGQDPAVLWYTADFLVGTMTMTDEQVGKYARLLNIQHQRGHLSYDEMIAICKTEDPIIFKKFKLDEEGLYYNVRMDKEADRRHKYVISRGFGKKKEKAIPGSAPDPLNGVPPEILKEEGVPPSEPVQKDPRFKRPTVSEVKKYCQQRGNTVNAEKFVAFYDSKGWMVGSNSMKNWKRAVVTWEIKIKEDKEKEVLQKGTHPGQIVRTGKVDTY